MLFIGQQDDITGLEFKTEGDDIDSVAGVLGKDDFLLRPRVDELFDYWREPLMPFSGLPSIRSVTSAANQ